MNVTVDFIQAIRAVGREEKRVTGSHKWELDEFDVTGCKSNGSDCV